MPWKRLRVCMCQNHVNCCKMSDTACFYVLTNHWLNINIFLFMYISVPLYVILCSSGKNSESQNVLNDLAQYEFLAHLRKASTSASLLDHMNHNGMAAVYYQRSRHDELPSAIWSPGAQHHSPEGAGRLIWHDFRITEPEMVTLVPDSVLFVQITHSAAGWQ